jgi:hypothetical protein
VFVISTLRARTTALVVGVALFVPSLGSPPARAAATPAHPARWASQVAPVAREVEKLRGLEFRRPVRVEFLADAAFGQRVAIDQGKLSASELDDLRRSQAQLAAVGLVPPGFDLVDAVSSLQQSGALAFYDPETKKIAVRGKELTPATEVTLAHELTHALQDQHFDLTTMRRAATRAHASNALTALVEGDARRIDQLYAAQLPTERRTSYERARGEESVRATETIRAAGIPDSLVVLFQSPYLLGPPMLAVAESIDGEDAVDDLFRDPPRSESAFLTPLTLDGREDPLRVERPTLGEGETVDGEADVFGAFGLYLTLATRLDPVRALMVADGWGGDAMITLRRADTTCVRATFAGRSEADGNEIGDALEQWAAAGPAGAAEVDRRGSRSTLTACEPPASSAETDGSLAALTVAVTRSELLAQFVGLDRDAASCIANGVVADPSFRPLLDAAVADPDAMPDQSVLGPVQSRILVIAQRCQR